MTAKVTLQSIADALGVSRMTVSNAFSRPDQLSAELRDRILATAREMGYAGPDPAARMLSTGRTATIGVLFTDHLTYAFTDPVAGQFLSGVAEVIEPEGLALTVLSSPREGVGRPAAATSAVMDGLIVYSVDEDSPGLATARTRGLPLVFADQRPEPGVPSVVVDDRCGARAAAEHLARLGHRRVAIFLEALSPRTEIVSLPVRPPHHVLEERLAGWLAGLGETAEVTVVNAAVNSRAAGSQGAHLALSRASPPTAFLCLSDEIANGVVAAVVERGLRVPEDVSVVGFDDGPAARWTTPPLTTVRQPVREKGAAAARLMLRRLASGPSAAVGAMVTLPTELVVRASTSTPPPPPTGARS